MIRVLHAILVIWFFSISWVRMNNPDFDYFWNKWRFEWIYWFKILIIINPNMSSRLHSCQDHWQHQPKDPQGQGYQMMHHVIHQHQILVAIYISAVFWYSQFFQSYAVWYANYRFISSNFPVRGPRKRMTMLRIHSLV